MKQKIVFFGAGWYTVPVIKKLLNHGLDLVITTERNPDSALLKFCAKNKIQTLTASSASDLNNLKSEISNHSIAILASYGAFVPDEIINIFPNGIINIHPSLLPKYKGPSPIQYALLNGETVTGVTLIRLDNEIDHGPILSQRPYNLNGNETTKDLLSVLFEIGAEMVEEIVLKLENDEAISEIPQDYSKESWSYKITKQDGYIDLSSIPLKTENWKLKIDCMIRAYYPWPGVWLKYKTNSKEQKEKSRLDGRIIKLLPEGKIQVEGKNPMSYKDFINGFGNEGKEILEKLGLI